MWALTGCAWSSVGHHMCSICDYDMDMSSYLYVSNVCFIRHLLHLSQQKEESISNPENESFVIAWCLATYLAGAQWCSRPLCFVKSSTSTNIFFLFVCHLSI